MSLVAYEASSGDESDDSNFHGQSVSIKETQQNTSKDISDDEEFNYLNQFDETNGSRRTKMLILPPPTVNSSVDNELSSCFQHLPPPKAPDIIQSTVIEEDDEFLQKKVKISEIEKPPLSKVKIKIPALSEFEDVNREKLSKSKTVKSSINSSSSLLNLLPKPKAELNYSKAPDSKPKSGDIVTTLTSLVPESVKNRQRNLMKAKLNNNSTVKTEENLVADTSDSDDEEADPDFFSLHTENILPEVNISEINAMVAKRAAQMAQASKIEETLVSNKVEEQNDYYSQKYEDNSQKLDQQALRALEGTSRQAKRRKANDINVIDLSDSQVLPNKDEWLRTQLTSSTYQPVGTLVDQELIPGTRRRHQITYLAHQAKANEAELQALWAANRQTKRQTQSKYGF